MHVPGTFNYVANGVVNHNTGIGKGRVVAATIRYAIRKGWTPVFVTEKPDLYGDMFRDMNDIGLHKMLGHEPRALMTNTGESVPLDEEALAWKQEADQARADGQPIPKRRGRFLTAGGKPAQEKAMQAMASGKGQHDIVFTTYDQMNTIKKQETDRRRFLRQIMPNSLLILDESHNAGGQGEKLFKAKHGDAPDRAEYVRGLVKGAAGVVYSSATFAKRPDVMDLYARTDMGKAVSDIMRQLALSSGRFEVVLPVVTDGAVYGLEQVEFRIGGLAGNEAKPLAKVASGGELSRISLAIQVLTSRSASVPTLIFDEVDVGIGGGVAEIVGRLLRELGSERQVLCVTHLPQVAAQANWQWQVRKSTQNGVTLSAIQPLDDGGRVQEIARMLGGVDITEITLQHARELLHLTA